MPGPSTTICPAASRLRSWQPKRESSWTFVSWNLDGETTRGQHTQNDSILAALEAVFPQPWTRNTWGLRLCERVFVHYAEKFDWPDLSVSEQRDTGTCRALKDQLAVLSDGTVVPCCLDHEGDVAASAISFRRSWTRF